MNEDSQVSEVVDRDENYAIYEGLTDDWGFQGPIDHGQQEPAN